MMGTSTRSVVHTARRAVATFAWVLQVLHCDQNRRAASEARPLSSHLPTTLGVDNERGVGELVVTGAGDITRMARLNQIIGGVVPGVPVNVVGHQVSITTLDVSAPVDAGSAPMTEMRPQTDLLKEDESMQRKLPARRGDNVTSSLNISVLRRSHAASVRHEVVSPSEP